MSDLRDFTKAMKEITGAAKSAGKAAQGVGKAIGDITGADDKYRETDATHEDRANRAEIRRNRSHDVLEGGQYSGAQGGRSERAAAMSSSDALVGAVANVMRMPPDSSERADAIRKISDYIESNPKLHKQQYNHASGTRDHTYELPQVGDAPRHPNDISQPKVRPMKGAGSPEQLIEAISQKLELQVGAPAISRSELGLPARTAPAPLRQPTSSTEQSAATMQPAVYQQETASTRVTIEQVVRVVAAAKAEGKYDETMRDAIKATLQKMEAQPGGIDFPDNHQRVSRQPGVSRAEYHAEYRAAAEANRGMDTGVVPPGGTDTLKVRFNGTQNASADAALAIIENTLDKGGLGKKPEVQVTMAPPAPAPAPVVTAAPAPTAAPKPPEKDFTPMAIPAADLKAPMAKSYSGIPTKEMPDGLRQTQVVEVQAMLQKAGFDIGKHGADGKCGKDTLDALKAACKAAGIEDYKKVNFADPKDPELVRLQEHLNAAAKERAPFKAPSPAQEAAAPAPAQPAPQVAAAAIPREKDTHVMPLPAGGQIGGKPRLDAVAEAAAFAAMDEARANAGNQARINLSAALAAAREDAPAPVVVAPAAPAVPAMTGEEMAAIGNAGRANLATALAAAREDAPAAPAPTMPLQPSHDAINQRLAAEGSDIRVRGGMSAPAPEQLSVRPSFITPDQAAQIVGQQPAPVPAEPEPRLTPEQERAAIERFNASRIRPDGTITRSFGPQAAAGGESLFSAASFGATEASPAPAGMQHAVAQAQEAIRGHAAVSDAVFTPGNLPDARTADQKAAAAGTQRA
jgi:hypothetical protein